MALDPSDRELLAATFADALESVHGADGDGVLAELGWADLLDAEPRDAIAVVFDRLGRANVHSTCLADVVTTSLGHPAGTAVVLPAYGSAEPPGRVVGDRVVVDGVLLVGGESLLVACEDGRVGFGSAHELTIEPAPGMDRSLELARVSGSASVIASESPQDWAETVGQARLALAHELVGASHSMLTLARDHALGRVQFGRPIASFQAVRHKLAEVLLAIESAEAALAAAHDQPSPLASTLAKVLAGRAAQAASAHCQQVLAGIGFTREHELHRYLQRAFVLDGLFGSTSSLTRELGALVIANRSVPKVVDL